MKSLKNLYGILKGKSLHYIFFRSTYELERKTGLLARKFPTSPKTMPLLSLAEWRGSAADYLFKDRESITAAKVQSEQLKIDAERTLEGDIRLFSKEWHSLGLDYDWVTNPSNGYRYDNRQHWTRVADFKKDAGDIKYVWEPSRFTFLYTVVRYDYNFDEDHSEWVIGRILDWIGKNPLNCGPNYKCSQEISLRVLNWLFALYFYKNSKALNDERWNIIVRSIYWQIHHVRQNINFSRISVRNNHAITETLTLYLTGLLFPSFPNAGEWKRNGKRWFEQEILFQYEPEGTYLQQSMNYQRVVTQLLTLAISLAERNGELFCKDVYDRAYANTDFLYQCMDDWTGLLPNYGANDGALFFQWHEQDYCDFRPQIRDLEKLLTAKGYPVLTKRQGIIAYEKGGYYLIRENDVLTFIRCGGFKGKNLADQLHIDIWRGGKNLIMDGGTYKYNTDDAHIRYFAGTESHSTVMLDDNGQMVKGPRFTWLYPLTVVDASLQETDETYIFEGKIWAYKQVAPNILLTRRVKKIKNVCRWEIIDSITGKPAGCRMLQLWHTCDDVLTFESDGARSETVGHFSRYYGLMADNRQIEFSTQDNEIRTTITIEI